MKETISILLIMICSFVNGQFSYQNIPTYTQVPINELKNIDNQTYVNCVDGATNNRLFMGKIYSNDDSLYHMTVPGSSTAYNEFMQVLDTNNLFVLSKDIPNNRYTIFRSRDGGNNWINIFDTTGYDVYTLAMIDTINGVIGGAWGQTCRTNDGGNNWICQSIPGLDYASNSGTINDSIIWLMMGNYSRFSYDTGKTWKIDGIAGNDTKKFLYLNKDTLYDLSNDVGDCKAFFTRTYDGGGLNWHQWMFNKKPILQDMEFINPQHGYVIGEDCATGEALLFRTLDEGATWERMHTGLTWGFLDMEFVNDSIALIGGEGGNLIKWNIHNFVNNTVGIAEATNETHEINIAPNPSRTQFTITSKDLSGPYQLRVMNMLGDAVITRRGQFNGELHLRHHLPPGVYLLSLHVHEERFVKKLIVETD